MFFFIGLSLSALVIVVSVSEKNCVCQCVCPLISDKLRPMKKKSFSVGTQSYRKSIEIIYIMYATGTDTVPGLPAVAHGSLQGVGEVENCLVHLGCLHISNSQGARLG